MELKYAAAEVTVKSLSLHSIVSVTEVMKERILSLALTTSICTDNLKWWQILVSVQTLFLSSESLRIHFGCPCHYLNTLEMRERQSEVLKTVCRR